MKIGKEKLGLMEMTMMTPVNECKKVCKNGALVVLLTVGCYQSTSRQDIDGREY